jgi:enolase-phosphatase E1
VTRKFEALLLDVEGTTTPIDFVYRVLFPYAHAHVAEYLERHFHERDVQADVTALAAEHRAEKAAGRTPPPWSADQAGVAAFARWLMDQDRKATSLKSLQGRIWEEGFATGALQGQVYDDVPRALERWTKAGRAVAIFSSGSVLAQKLVFGRSNSGDLTAFLRAYFDTTTGPKRDPESYRKIAASWGTDPAAILFVSDVGTELDAAKAAGLETALIVRDRPLPGPGAHRVVRTFDDLP